MRLINIKTLQLETFDNWDSVPPYAILSHTWEDGEVLFRDISTDLSKEKKGWSKILGSCAEAEKLGIFYLWVDTCCIFKESSAELSESINSMFAWYRDARICFAYMGDFGEKDKGVFDESKWWTRGWTLQELIAPTEVMFFTQDWKFIGFRTTLSSRIAQITGIDEEILSGGNLDKLHTFSVAQKFSWASKRKTTRGEDRAYSLIGIFGVSMSMIYGEGEQSAFFRLQKEIFGVYADHSIFAWKIQSGISPTDTLYDFFAPSVSAFEHSSDIINEPYSWDILGRPKSDKIKTVSDRPLAKFSAFSHGICVQLLVQRDDEIYCRALLACRYRKQTNTCLCINLVLDRGLGQYLRGIPESPYEIKLDSLFRTTLVDVYMAQPRLDFALSHRPVRYQLKGFSDLSNSDSSVYLMEDAVYKAGFTPDLYMPQAEMLELPEGNPDLQARRVVRLWNHDQESAVIYRNPKTDESFAVIIATSQKFRSMPQRFLVGIVDGISPGISETAIVDDFFKDNNYSLTDLSTRLLVKFLPSGRQVVLSVNAFSEGSALHFKLWVSVQEAEAEV